MILLAQLDWNIVNATFARYGIWGVSAFLIGLFLYKKVWPEILSQWRESRQAKRDREALADKVLLENAEQNRQMMNTTIKEFADALRASNRESRSVVSQLQALTADNKKQNELLHTVSEHLETLTAEVRKK
jgi:hypothetical protein